MSNRFLNSLFFLFLTICISTAQEKGGYDVISHRASIYGKISENRIADDLVAKFPIRVAGDAVTIEGKNYIDSLAVIQIIENPYRDQGLMCWIVPLTNNSFPHLLPHDASYAVVEKKEVVEKGTWVIKDEDLVVEIK